MAYFTSTDSRRIARNPQMVLINGAHDPDVYCEGITPGIGTAGSTATFSVPRLKWDEARNRYTGAEVVVYAGENNSTGVSGDAWFHGWIKREPKKRGPRNNTYSFSAESAIKILDKMPVGVGGWTWKDFDGENILTIPKKGISARYPRLSAMRRGRRAVLWRPKDVIQDIFDGLPSFYRLAIGLGDTRVLRDEPFQKKGLVEWDFTAVSVLEALESLVAAYGDVAFVERFQGMGSPRVKLDFFRISDRSAGRKTFVIPECGDGRIGVQEIAGNTDIGDCIDRVILAGGPYRIMLTAWTGDANASRRLRKGWVSKLVTITTTEYSDDLGAEVTTEVTKTNEEWVLDDPDFGRRGSNLFHPDCEWCFRRYYLPPCLLARGLHIEEENAVRQLQVTPSEDDPKRIGKQIFKTRLTYSTRKTDYEIASSLAAMGRLTSSYGYDCGGEYNEGYGYQTPVGFRLLNLAQADLVGELIPDQVGESFLHPLELLSGADIGGDGTVVLNEPATNIIYKSYCGTKEQVIRAEADVAVTITVAREDRLEMDTGQPPFRPGRLATIGNDGSIFSDFDDNAWQYEQITNLGFGPRLSNGEYVAFPFTDPSTGEAVYFDYCVYGLEYDPDADDPELVKLANNEQLILTHVLGQQVLRNDYPVMQEFGNRQLRLKSRPARTYEVTLPIATRAYKPGDMVRFDGIEDIVSDDYSVTDIAITFDPRGTNFQTVLSVTNAKPEESARVEM